MISFDEDPYASPEAQEQLRRERASQYLDRLAIPGTDADRAMTRRHLSGMHRANRFRLMFGQPLLSEQGEPQDQEPTSTPP